MYMEYSLLKYHNQIIPKQLIALSHLPGYNTLFIYADDITLLAPSRASMVLQIVAMLY